MLVILMEDQLLSTAAVCKSCLMADRSGEPRWQGGQLKCGRRLALGQADCEQGATASIPVQYECQMGFRIAEV
jgi:hypothetical protein